MIDKQLGFVFDYEKCFGCRACEIACKNENNDKGESGWRRLVELESFSYVTVSCNHCQNPECFRVCPEQVFIKRQDGIVMLDTARCSGCQLCLSACPFGAITFDYHSFKVTKCQMCYHRIEEGLEPACVSACSTNALQFGDIYELEHQKVERRYKDFPETLITNPSLVFKKGKNKVRQQFFIN